MLYISQNLKYRNSSIIFFKCIWIYYTPMRYWKEKRGVPNNIRNKRREDERNQKSYFERSKFAHVEKKQ